MRAVLLGAVLLAAIGAAVSCTLNVSGSGDPFEQGSGGMGGNGGSGGGGIPCSSDAECPDDTTCANWQCSANSVCEVSFAPEGTPIAGSIIGDCRQSVCGPGGSEILTNDDEDTPDDGNDCTRNRCENGMPDHPFEDNGTTCGVSNGDLYCSNGECIGCMLPEECSANPCQDPTCEDSVCGTVPRAAGTQVEDPSQLDCVRDVCDGMSGIVVGADPDDVPDDTNPCTMDTCQGTMVSNADLANGTMCPTGFCYQGACSQCGIDTNCPVTDAYCQIPHCNGGMCAPVTNEPDGTACGPTGQGECCMGVCEPAGCGAGGGGGMGGGGMGGMGGNP